MRFDYSSLSGRIVEKFGTRTVFAEKMGLSERSLSLKLNNKAPWKQTEMQKAALLLEFPEKEISRYFFTLKVQ